MIRAIYQSPISVILGAAFGLLLAMLSVTAIQWAAESYDDSNHVLSLHAVVLKSDTDEIVLHVTGEKLRECQYIRLQAYTVHPGVILKDAQIARVDQHEDRDSKPKGSFDFGTWRIWPRGDAVGVQVYSQHLCGARMVVQKVVDMKVSR